MDDFVSHTKDFHSIAYAIIMGIIGLGFLIYGGYQAKAILWMVKDLVTGLSPSRIAAREQEEEAIDQVLSGFLAILGADRIMMCLFEGDEGDPKRVFSCKYEKRRPGVEPVKKQLQNLLVKDLPECQNCVRPGVVYQELDVEGTPPSAMRSLLTSQGVKAYLCYPVMPGGKTVGFVWVKYMEPIDKRLQDGDVDRPRILPDTLSRCATHLEGILYQAGYKK